MGLFSGLVGGFLRRRDKDPAWPYLDEESVPGVSYRSRMGLNGIPDVAPQDMTRKLAAMSEPAMPPIMGNSTFETGDDARNIVRLAAAVRPQRRASWPARPLRRDDGAGASRAAMDASYRSTRSLPATGPAANGMPGPSQINAGTRPPSSRRAPSSLDQSPAARGAAPKQNGRAVQTTPIVNGPSSSVLARLERYGIPISVDSRGAITTSLSPPEIHDRLATLRRKGFGVEFGKDPDIVFAGGRSFFQPTRQQDSEGEQGINYVSDDPKAGSFNSVWLGSGGGAVRFISSGKGPTYIYDGPGRIDGLGLSVSSGSRARAVPPTDAQMSEASHDPRYIFNHRLVSRAGWGAERPDFTRDIKLDGDFDTITLHHTGRYDAPKSVEFLHRGGEWWRRALSWTGKVEPYKYGDVGYHFLIDQKGNIYEGRSLEFMGSHVYHHNARNIGIAMLGNYSSNSLAKPQLESLDALMTVLRGRYPGIRNVGTHGQFDPSRRDELIGAQDQVRRFLTKQKGFEKQSTSEASRLPYIPTNPMLPW